MVKIQFNDMKIDKLSRSSGVFSGDNFHFRANATDKRNEGTGQLSGDGTVQINNRHLVIDSDFFDIVHPDHPSDNDSK
ncbi:hypothetical protein [Fictibacillus fluitans]|uniref:Uncharacterized protein n=1 Tax=Fictibacillus fluitans TaxID=3058422 RepID=A0ABT8I104_9BACL|nr:hypothetical protein [Fictibacillus sp. NE201]MDN4526704.1 hypothetical protein [Fictibacillus sp. NE201]